MPYTRTVRINLKGFLILLVLIFSMIKTNGQTNRMITYHFKIDTISILAEKTFINSLIINNNDSREAVLIRKGLNKDMDAAILGLPPKMVVKAGQSVSYPLKYFADSKTILANIQSFKLELRSASEGFYVQESAVFYTQLRNSGGLILDTQSAEIYLDPITNKADLQIRVFNDGMIPLIFVLDLTEVPKGLEFTGMRGNITLEAGAEKLLPFLATNKSKNNGPADFSVMIRALDQSGNQMAERKVRVMTVSSNRNLVLNDQDIFYQNRPNRLSLNHVSSNDMQLVQLLGSGNIELKKDHLLSYNLNLNYTPLIGGQLSSTSSYISYENKLMGIKIGNIFENLDFSAFGRGIKGSAYLGDQKSINAYVIQSNPMLFSSKSMGYQGGSTYALEYNYNSQEKGNSRLIFLQNKDELNKLVSRLISGKMQMVKSDKENLTIGAGYSILSHENNKNAMFGLGLELTYNQRSASSSFSSTSYYSTPDYGGLRRGTFYTENRFVYSINSKNNVVARLSLMDNRPNSYYRDYNDYVKMTNQYGTQTFELGYERIVNNWRFGVFPYYFGQQMQVRNDLNSAKLYNWKSMSARARLDLSYADAGQYINLSIDNGYTCQNTSERPPAPFFSSRVNLSYRNNIFGFSSFYQYKPYYIADALTYSGGNNSNMLSGGPTIGFSAFKKRMSLTSSLMYSYYGYNSNQNYSLNAYTRYLLRGEWAVTANVFYGLNRQELFNTYNPQTGIDYSQKNDVQRDYTYFSNRMISIGVEKNFGRSATGKMIKKMKLTYFEDLNANGIKDTEEQVIPGILVKIKNLAAITNKDGIVQFSAPTGDYEVSVVSQNGWSTLSANNILLTKDTRMEIGMVKTLRLRGITRVEKRQYSEANTNLSTLQIYAVGESGRIYSTVCEEDGSFHFYLPGGKYLVYLKEIPSSFTALNSKQEIILSKDVIPELIFNLEDNHIKIDVKEF